ncbi:orotidine-5'-phosphate decarboxylase [Candidatus Sumerlaeota bacterium]|nr:orotidine-5'-phosphate decarboxylase [Candidatus Sumerlaeota bacterium]
MEQPPFFDRLAAAQKRNRSLLCVGLDPDPAKLPAPFKRRDAADVARFNREIVEATADLVCAYKPNWAFYEAMGLEGMKALDTTLEAIPDAIPVIADAKRGDIGNTAAKYARAIFETWNADAVTVSPYLGLDTLEPFLEYRDRGVYVLCLTSNPGSADFQTPRRLYLDVARKLALGDKYGNIGLVVGATQSRRIASVRQAAPRCPFLLPGVGSQGGSARAAVRGAWGERPGSVVVNVARAVTYASSQGDFAQAAREAASRFRREFESYVPEGR